MFFCLVLQWSLPNPLKPVVGEDVVGAVLTGDAPTTSEGLLPKVQLILEVWRYLFPIGVTFLALKQEIFLWDNIIILPQPGSVG